MSPSSAFKASVTSELDRLIAQFDRDIDGLDRQIEHLEKLKVTRAEKQAVLDALKAASPTVKRGNFYFVGSRTRKDGAGHFIEKYDDGTSKCSCEGGKYGGSCWAQTYIKNVLKPTDTSFSYIGQSNGKGSYTTAESFDRREKPYGGNYGFNFIPYGYKQF